MTSSTFCQHVGNTMDEGTAAGVLPQRRPSPRLERDSRQFFHGSQSLVLPRSRLTQLLSNNLFSPAQAPGGDSELLQDQRSDGRGGSHEWKYQSIISDGYVVTGI